MSHQLKALAYAATVMNPAFFMEMRLGKTLVLIWHAQRLDARLVMVTGPLTVLEGWQDELEEAGEPYLDLGSVPPAKREDVLLRQVLKCKHRVFVLVSLDLLRHMTFLADIPWDLAAIDESVRIKNITAQITRICVNGFRYCRHRAILTGMPAPESELEFFSQFMFLDGRFMGHSNFYKFREEFFQPHPHMQHHWMPKKGTRPLIKEVVREKAFVLRRKDVDIGSRKFHEKRYVDMGAEQKRIYKSVINDFAYEVDGEWNETQWGMTKDLWLQRLAGGFDPTGERCLNDAKAREIVHLLKTELSGQQVVVWFRFRSELDMVRRLFKKAGISSVHVDGDVPKADRGRARKLFTQGKARTFLATEKCAKMGVDCSVADTAIYYSNEWSCDDRIQSEDRIVHSQKRTPLLYIDMVTRGTVDEEAVSGVRLKTFNAKDMLMKHIKLRRSA